MAEIEAPAAAQPGTIRRSSKTPSAAGSVRRKPGGTVRAISASQTSPPLRLVAAISTVRAWPSRGLEVEAPRLKATSGRATSMGKLSASPSRAP